MSEDVGCGRDLSLCRRPVAAAQLHPHTCANLEVQVREIATVGRTDASDSFASTENLALAHVHRTQVRIKALDVGSDTFLIERDMFHSDHSTPSTFVVVDGGDSTMAYGQHRGAEIGVPSRTEVPVGSEMPVLTEWTRIVVVDGLSFTNREVEPIRDGSARSCMHGGENGCLLYTSPSPRD